jgi:hypothetical protein
MSPAQRLPGLKDARLGRLSPVLLTGARLREDPISPVGAL